MVKRRCGEHLGARSTLAYAARQRRHFGYE
jgi:hypothetical protein